MAGGSISGGIAQQHISSGVERDLGSRVSFGDLSAEPVDVVDPEVLGRTKALSKAILTSTIGLDKGLRKRSRGKEFVLGANFSGINNGDSIEALETDDAIVEIEKNIRAINDLGLTHLPDEWRLIRANQVALGVFLGEVERSKTGEDLSSYSEYLQLVSGFEATRIPDDKISDNLETAKELLSSLGVDFVHDNDESFTRAVKRHSTKNRLKSKRVVENKYEDFDRRNRTRLSAVLGGQHFTGAEFQIEWVNEPNKFWFMFESPDTDVLMANWGKEWDVGWVETLAGHETVHFIHYQLMKQHIKDGFVDPAAGLHIIPGVGCYAWEGLAQVVGDFAGYKVDQTGKLARELYRLGKRALNNALFDIEIHGVDPEKIAQSLKVFMPKNGIDEIRTLLGQGIEQPWERALFPCYGLADYELMELQDKFGDSAAHFLLSWLQTHNTREQMREVSLGHLIDI